MKTFDYIGLHRYFLTFCTDSRRLLFTTSPVVDLVMQQIERSATEERFAIVAYCFMPDHLHLLVEAAAESSDCRRFIQPSETGLWIRLREGVQKPPMQDVVPSFRSSLVVSLDTVGS